MMLLLAAVVLLWGVVEAADSCHFPVTESRRQRLLENMCAGRGDDPTLCNRSSTPPAWASTRALTESIDDFVAILSRRPFERNVGGMGFNHLFSLWSTMRAIQPPVVVESGVFCGQGTWLIRETLPSARIVSIDPSMPPSAWFDNSSLTTYLNGTSDFGSIDWPALVPSATDRAAGLVLLDDHMSAVRRVAEAVHAGFGHIWYDDNGECALPGRPNQSPPAQS